jgi:hypothetical protein
MLLPLLAALSLASAGEFPHDRLAAHTKRSTEATVKAQAFFRTTRDVKCARSDSACLGALLRLRGEFDAMRESIEAFDRFTREWDESDAASAMTDDEKKEVRLAYARALRGLIFYADGLDAMLNLPAPNPLLRLAFDAAQSELQRAADRYSNALEAFGTRAGAAVSKFPRPH